MRSVLLLPNSKAGMSSPLSKMQKGRGFWQHQCLLSKGRCERDILKIMDVWREGAGAFYLEGAFISA